MKTHSREPKRNHLLSVKNCPVCLRDFNWRKKWQKDWHNVVYCSKRCQRHKHQEHPNEQKR